MARLTERCERDMMATDFADEAREYVVKLARESKEDLSTGAFFAIDSRGKDGASIAAKMLIDNEGKTKDEAWSILASNVAAGIGSGKAPVMAIWCSLGALRRLMAKQKTNHKFDEWLDTVPPRGLVRLLMISDTGFVSFEVLPYMAIGNA